MKTKKLLSILLLLSVCVATALNVYNQSQTPQYSDLTIANIEAMAGDGGGEYFFNKGPGFERTCNIDYNQTGDHCTASVWGCSDQNEYNCNPLLCDRHGFLPTEK